jgi:hypothetical protein
MARAPEATVTMLLTEDTKKVLFFKKAPFPVFPESTFRFSVTLSHPTLPHTFHQICIDTVQQSLYAYPVSTKHREVMTMFTLREKLVHALVFTIVATLGTALALCSVLGIVGGVLVLIGGVPQ